MTLNLIRQCRISNLSKKFNILQFNSIPVSMSCINYVLSYRAKIQTGRLTVEKTATHTDSDKYSIVAFCKTQL